MTSGIKIKNNGNRRRVYMEDEEPMSKREYSTADMYF